MIKEGVVKFWDAEKGFGFIKPDNGKMIYTNIARLRKAGLTELKPKQRISFRVKSVRLRGGDKPRRIIASRLKLIQEN